MAKVSFPTIAISSFCLALALGSWFLVLPLLKDIGTGKSDLTRANQQVVLVQKKVAAAVPPTSQEQELIDNLLPASDEQYDLAVQVEALSHTAGVSLDSLNMTVGTVATADLPTTSSTQNVNLSISVSGAYPAVKSFIQGLTSLGRYVQIGQLTISGGAASASGGSSSQDVSTSSDHVSTQITALAYFLPASPSAK